MTDAENGERLADRQAGQEQLPEARRGRSRWTAWFWAIPLAALALVGWLALKEWVIDSGDVTVIFARAEGLSPGAAVRYRGASVGRVKDIKLTRDLEHVKCRAPHRGANRQSHRRRDAVLDRAAGTGQRQDQEPDFRRVCRRAAGRRQAAGIVQRPGRDAGVAGLRTRPAPGFDGGRRQRALARGAGSVPRRSRSGGFWETTSARRSERRQKGRSRSRC